MVDAVADSASYNNEQPCGSIHPYQIKRLTAVKLQNLSWYKTGFVA